MTSLKHLSMISLLAGVMLIQGCAVAVVGATAVGVKSATDRRSVGTQLDDQTIEVRVSRALGDAQELEDSRVKAVSYNNSILLVGQATSDNDKRLAERLARDVSGVDQVYNQLRSGNPISFITQTQDTWITSKVKTRLLSEDSIDGSQIKVVTENSEVFLLGIVDNAEAERAVNVTRNLTGVKHVITAFTKPE